MTIGGSGSSYLYGQSNLLIVFLVFYFSIWPFVSSCSSTISPPGMMDSQYTPTMEQGACEKLVLQAVTQVTCCRGPYRLNSLPSP